MEKSFTIKWSEKYHVWFSTLALEAKGQYDTIEQADIAASNLNMLNKLVKEYLGKRDV